MNRLQITPFVLLYMLLAAADVLSQSGPTITTFDSAGGKWVRMAPGERFASSKWKQFWWGKHWRPEWLKPVAFPVFDLDTTAGGLTALKRGGGHETKTLRLKGKNGKEYVLRTIDKSLDVLVPEVFKGSVVNDIVNDQISTAHPYGPLVVAKLSGSIGIMHTNPVIAFVPDNPILAEFRSDFANKLCLFEERMSGEGWDQTPLTRYASDVINSEKLLERVQEENDRLVDQKEYLKVRLFDMLVNDWDRHEDQWVWTAQKKGGRTLYQPFARDRDQTFSKTDGVILYFMSKPWALRSLQNMKGNLRDVKGSNLSAVFLDKQFMNALTETDWVNIIQSLQQSLTDADIMKALQVMPPAIYALSGDFLYKRLRQRRDNMMDYGMEYYKIINNEVSITGSDKQEHFVINSLDGNTTEITVTAAGKKNDGDTVFHRIFNSGLTRAVNLYGLGDNDKFTFTGNASNRIVVRAFGNDGNDLFEGDPNAGLRSKKLRVYDTLTDRPADAKLFRYYATRDTAVTNYNRKAFKYDWWKPLFLPAYNPDDGVLIGAGITYKRQQWHKHPFGWQQTIGANYALATGAYGVFYKGIFKQVLGNWDLNINASYKAPTYVVNFYGFGNDTKLLTKKKSFYRIRATSFLLNPAVSRSWKQSEFSIGPIFTTVKVNSDGNKFINQPLDGIDSAVYRTNYFGGAAVSYNINTSDNLKNPVKGINYLAGSSWLSNLKEAKSYLNLESSFTFYYTPFNGVTLAHRTGASTNIGEFEFYQGNTLGGMDNLRGYWRTRFTGRTSFYQNTDVRWRLAEIKGYVIRGTLGIYGFFDDGRVWIKSDHSNGLHTGYGGGIYFIPYRTLALNVAYASSKEVNVFSFRTGFLF